MPYRHHEVVASLTPDEQEEWLDAAEPEGPGEAPRLSSRELREAIKNEEEPEGVQRVEAMDCPSCGGTGKVLLD